jgi:hypothetical protein
MPQPLRIAVIASLVAGFGLAGFYRAEVARLRADLARERAATPAAAAPRNAERAPQAPAEPVAGKTEPLPAATTQRLLENPEALGDRELVALSDQFLLAGARPTYLDVQLMRRLARAPDGRDRSELARRLLQSSHDEARLAGIRELLRSAPAEGSELLRDFVTGLSRDSLTGDWSLAQVAIESLKELPGAAAERELYAYLDADTPMLRTPAARVLEERGRPEPMRELIANLERELDARDARQRVQAVADLMRTRSPSAHRPLLHALRDSDPAVRRRAVQAFALTGDSSVIPHLETALRDLDAGVRESAARVIAELTAKTGEPR